MASDLNKEAGKGMIFVCRSCGKTSPTRSGWSTKNEFVGMRGWDSSCMMHSAEYRKDSLRYDKEGRVVEVLPVDMSHEST